MEFSTIINKVAEDIDKVVTIIEEIENEILEKTNNPTTTSSGKYRNYTKGELKVLQGIHLKKEQSLRDKEILLLKEERYLKNGTNTSANTFAGQGKYIILYHLIHILFIFLCSMSMYMNISCGVIVHSLNYFNLFLVIIF
jgi:hypothetical protein